MTRLYTDKVFANLRDYGSGATIADSEFCRCRFTWCILSSTLDPRLRTTVRNVKLIKCVYDGGALDSAIVEDTVVEDLSAPRLHTCGMVFKHVVLRGHLSGPLIGPLYAIGGRTEADVKPINDANREYYKHVDWALDITEAQFKDECDIRNIPARLIRRDAATQAVVRRENVLDDRWKSLDLGETHWQTTIQWMLDRGDDDCVLVAPKRARNFRQLLNGIELLRAEGIADPD